MRIDLDKHVFNQDMKPLRDGDAPAAGVEDKRAFTTIRDVVRRALLSEAAEPVDEGKQPKRLSDDEKFNRFSLAMKVQGAKIGEEFTEAERTKIVTVASWAWPTLIYGQILTAFVQESAVAKPAEVPASAAPVAPANTNGAAAHVS